MPSLVEIRRVLFRSEEHTSELQSLTNLVCRLLLVKKIKHKYTEKVLKEINSETLSRADLSGANLSEANLIGADLSGADLSEANLCFFNLRAPTLTAPFSLLCTLHN